MIQRCQDLRLSLEAGQTLRIGRDCVRQNLDGHLAHQPRVSRPVHFPHPSGPKGRDDVVWTEPSSGRKRHDCFGAGVQFGAKSSGLREPADMDSQKNHAEEKALQHRTSRLGWESLSIAERDLLAFEYSQLEKMLTAEHDRVRDHVNVHVHVHVLVDEVGFCSRGRNSVTGTKLRC
jgi:hypothetical protein